MSHDASSLVIPYLVSVSPSLYLYRKEGGGGGLSNTPSLWKEKSEF